MRQARAIFSRADTLMHTAHGAIDRLQDGSAATRAARDSFVRRCGRRRSQSSVGGGGRMQTHSLPLLLAMLRAV